MPNVAGRRYAVVADYKARLVTGHHGNLLIDLGSQAVKLQGQSEPIHEGSQESRARRAVSGQAGDWAKSFAAQTATQMGRETRAGDFVRVTATSVPRCCARWQQGAHRSSTKNHARPISSPSP
jgi:hypothetical protein